ncbi:GEVED domain-containing protein [Chryseobacterium sp.]|uniref:GEVED domain-containing protein n=1 Tax=Chryseobacterium sp. TaxID=1871047 RepID=UPI00388F23FA
MKKIFTSFLFFFLSAAICAQWSQATFKGEKAKGGPDVKDYYSLDISQLKSQLLKAQEAGKDAKPVIINLPTLDGGIEEFAVYSFPVVVPELATKYDLGSYAGTSLKDPSKYVRFSTAPNDFQSMIIKGNHYEFIEPANKDKTIYGIHAKSKKSDAGFFCSTNESLKAKQSISYLSQNGFSFAHQVGDFSKNSDKKYRTMRLAMSVTGEYTQYHGGTVAGALAAINATITRVNGVFEKDFALHLNLQNFPNVIYTNAATDPYSAAAAGAGGAWNGELQNTLTANVGNANYDIGHLFGASGGGGNAGCIGCVCINPTTAVPDGKGSGYTSPGDGIPQGDNFDIDYVAHEMGHQLGANHTFAHSINGQMPGALIEPGSGSSIMGYAGITGVNTNVQLHSDAYFNRYNINQVQVNLISKTCDIETAVTNNPPVIADLPTYNIPKSTAFVLTASVTDPENDPMTYNWEQQDAATVIINKANLGTTTSGATFRSVAPSTSPTRYFPALATVLSGTVSSPNTWEAVSSIARTTKFSITARDNNAIPTQQQTQSADQTIIVGNDGPFRVTSTNAYNSGTTNVTWDVVNTTAVPYNVSNVKIDYTKDNGLTWIVLAASTPNDGSEALTFTGVNAGDVVKIRVSAINNVFYAIGSATVTTVVLCTTIPTTINMSAITQTQANASWSAAAGATYNIQYRPIGSSAWISATSATNSILLTGLTPGTMYEIQVANVCSGIPTGFSASTQFTTATLSYCPITSASASSYINNVSVIATNSYTMSNNSGATPYSDFSTSAPALITLIRGSANNTLSVGRFIASSTYATSAWIDFNGNGVFEATERVMNLPYSSTTPVTATFNVPAGAYAGTSTVKMRVVMSYLTITDPCANVTSSGEIEDYAVKFDNLQPCTAVAPSNIGVSNLTAATANVSWVSTAGATYILRYRVGTTGAWTTINPATNPQTITGLTEQTGYEVQVATICGGVTSAFSPSTIFTTPSLTYCPAVATSADEFISNVTITGTGVAPMVSNSTLGIAPFYSDYTADPARLVTLIRGSVNNTISVKREWPGTQYSNVTKAWIDFNRNGTFEDSERILQSPSNTVAVVNATFNVPVAGTYAGNLLLRMRVITSESSTTPACGSFSYGEVEDYSVKLIDLLPCTTAPPSLQSVTNLTATTAYVSWLPAAGASYRIRWRQGTTGAWLPTPLGYLDLPAGQSFYTITGLTEQTNYQVQIMTICNGTAGTFGTSIPFTTPPLTYCPMVGTGTNDYISNVKVTPVNFPVMSNTSLQTNYISYTTPATLINLEVGSAGNQIIVSKAWQNSSYSDAVYAYIDYNRDGVFADSERIMTSAASTTTPVIATFTVSNTVYTGPYTTTMRVVLKRSSAPAMCADPANGEVEDYAVRLKPCSNVAPSTPTFNTITHTSATVTWTPAANNNSYILQYRPVTNPVSAWTTVNVSAIAGNPPVVLASLIPATLYEVQIAAVCGGGPGSFTPIRTFITRCDPTPPNVVISNVTATSAVVTWNPTVVSATYSVRYREVGSATWTTINNLVPPVNSYTITGLSSYKIYEVQVSNTCVGETTNNPWSNPQVFTTVRVCEVPPPNFTITQLTPTTAEVHWDPFPGATYILRYRKVGIPSWTMVPVNNPTYTITGLLELTKYEMQVVNVCSGTPGNYTDPYFFTTPTVAYCQMSSSSSTTEFISKVTAKPDGKPVMINESGASNYTDYTGVPDNYIEMVQGTSNNQIIIDKKLGSGVSAGVAVWIDFNRNGYFDLNERIMADGPNGNPTASATFAVPADAFVSMTDYKYVVMRVAMQKDGIPVNCLSFQNGEVEDYTVRISKQPAPNSVNQTDILIYPNPVSTILYVKNISKKATYKIYASSGQLVSNGYILNNKIDVSKLINGVYVIDIEDVQGTVQKKFIKE